MEKTKKFPIGSRLKTLYRIGGLVFAFLFVDVIYDQVIEPGAEEATLKRDLLKENDPNESSTSGRSVFIILQNTEQQICASLLLWAFLLIVEKYWFLARERQTLDMTFLQLGKGERIIPNNALGYFRSIRQYVDQRGGLRHRLLPQFILNALHRFHATHSISAVSESIQQDSEVASDQMDTDLSLIRYIGWAIPSIGFIGTVRGIGEALAQAEQAIEGDISGVTASLGLAFNSTLVALLFSIVLTFFVYMLQSAQDNLVLRIGRYCQENLLGAMKTPVLGPEPQTAGTPPATAPAGSLT
ncbi:MAG: MotA/TolQ/ExbB proton channel family protein [Opitutales bacterium]